MKRTSISGLKARLSAYLDVVRGGDDVIITDRGRPIARLTPVVGVSLEESRRELLMRSGQMRPPSGDLPPDYFRRPRPADPDARALAALLHERAEGW